AAPTNAATTPPANTAAAPGAPAPSSRWPTAFTAAQRARNPSGSPSPPASGMSTKKPCGSVITRRHVSTNAGSTGRACRSGPSMAGRPYSGAAGVGPGAGGRARCIMRAMDARTDAGAAFRAALARVAPGPLVRERLARDAGALVLRDARGAAVGRHAGPVLIVGAGKAALDMARAAADAVGAWSAGGVVVVPHAAVGPCGGGVEVLGARHPVPDEAGVRASMRLVARVASADATALVLVCLSGGASSLLEVPAAGLALADVQALGA